ncbi:hypothetical protein J437_LFUL016687 [Ladona fulva]|uniref:Uncharacterized protein n=1 Tax=Ladona fulva TaxID=123851 RepID=A0A8K0KQ99_LADFU|nr:hypothetical protein J437_LFUL016687 [Ladona fulva]
MENMDQNKIIGDSEISDEEFIEMRSLLYQSTVEHINKITKGILNLTEDLQNIRSKTEQTENCIVEVLNRIEAYE